MQAIAAWVGAVLGVINLTFAISGRRPPMFIRYKEVSGGRLGIVITIVAASTPILVKRLWVLPHRGKTNVMALGDDPTMFRDHAVWSRDGRFNMLIPPEGTRQIQVSFDPSDLPGMLILQWSDSRIQICPVSFWCLKRAGIERLRDAEPPGEH
jgi:hypothetical protein